MGRMIAHFNKNIYFTTSCLPSAWHTSVFGGWLFGSLA